MRDPTPLIPRLIAGAAVLHTPAGLADLVSWRAADAAPIWEALGAAPEDEAVVWFLVAGLVLLASRALARWAEHETGRLPARPGWWLVGVSPPVVVVLPAPGTWPFLAAGVLAVAVSCRRWRPVAPSGGSSPGAAGVRR